MNTVRAFVKYRTGCLKGWDAHQTVRVLVEYHTGVTVKGKGGGPSFKGVCCKEWAVTINPVTTLENSTNFALCSLPPQSNTKENHQKKGLATCCMNPNTTKRNTYPSSYQIKVITPKNIYI